MIYVSVLLFNPEVTYFMLQTNIPYNTLDKLYKVRKYDFKIFMVLVFRFFRHFFVFAILIGF